MKPCTGCRFRRSYGLSFLSWSVLVFTTHIYLRSSLLFGFSIMYFHITKRNDVSPTSSHRPKTPVQMSHTSEGKSYVVRQDLKHTPYLHRHPGSTRDTQPGQTSFRRHIHHPCRYSIVQCGSPGLPLTSICLPNPFPLYTVFPNTARGYRPMNTGSQRSLRCAPSADLGAAATR
jgi:hypothetical protein